MSKTKQPLGNAVSVVIPNLNGAGDLAACLDSLQKQTLEPKIIVVDNASTDNSLELLKTKYKSVEVIEQDKNYGFAGGVNPGIKLAIKNGDKYVALLNNDAVADPKWLEALVSCLNQNPKAGIVTSKIVSSTGEYLDSTGDFYTSWGLPYPRGRREASLSKYDDEKHIFSASGGASLYRIDTLKQIGLFDEDFFAYYEDVDISFRARLAGWDVLYEPGALVLHHINATSNRMPGLATQQTVKNLPWLVIKNVPTKLLPEVLPRFSVLYWSIFFKALVSGNAWPATKGLAVSILLLPKKLAQRYKIQRGRELSANQVSDLLVHDLPPDAHKLRALRRSWWRLTRKA